MHFLTQREKSSLVFLISGALIATVLTIYLGLNIQQMNEKILSNKIHVIHTGGEIEEHFIKKYEHNIGKYSINSYKPLMNSSNIVPKDWNIIAEDIGRKYNNYDAFVIVCGRDTLVYTASALAFMMENLTKPIILTDGDVDSAVRLSSKTKIPEVMISSGGKLLRACRTVHKSSHLFTSPNYSPLEDWNCLKSPTEPPRIKFINPKINIIVVKIFPGMTAKYFLNLINANVQGIVLEMYCLGNAPTSKKFLESISILAEKGVVIVAVSQCDEISEYDVDIRLLEAGVLSGYDMTTPAAYAKLSFLLSNVENKKLIGQLMEKSFRGEMTELEKKVTK
jgi:L-asparaginase